MEILHKVPRIRFMAQRKIAYVLSALIVIGSIAAEAVNGLNLAVDFTGGVVIEANYAKAADLDATRAALNSAGYHEAQVQIFGSSRDVLVRLPPLGANDSANAVTAKIEATLRTVDSGVQIRRTEVVGPQVGKELVYKGMQAMAITVLLILVYIAFRFRWKFGVGAVLATLHDPFVVVGVFAITGMTFDLSVLAAVLAVIGYSINETVVVFDRVRELFPVMRKEQPIEVFDRAINETLSRTLITKFATLIVVVALYAFGGETLRGFGLALIVGILAVTYSSMYVASGVALDLGSSHRDLMPSERRAPVDDLP
ncbi:MAG: protein translocase subunit SecF [Proteobacteria bacterium]|nr:protein translocase subunit SecF [Pseudomonadota bacterium]